MKKIIFILAILALPLVVKATAYDYLIISQQDGTQTTLSVDGLTMTFANGMLVAQTSDDSRQFELSTLATMFFSEEPSGISQTTASPVSIRLTGRLLQVSAPEGATVTIATAGGMLIDRYRAAGYDATTALRPGIYIIKVNDKSSKLCVK